MQTMLPGPHRAPANADRSLETCWPRYSKLQKVRKADADTLIVADGTSCLHQIHDGTAREAQHVARMPAAALPVA